MVVIAILVIICAFGLGWCFGIVWFNKDFDKFWSDRRAEYREWCAQYFTEEEKKFEKKMEEHE